MPGGDAVMAITSRHFAMVVVLAIAYGFMAACAASPDDVALPAVASSSPVATDRSALPTASAPGSTAARLPGSRRRPPPARQPRPVFPQRRLKTTSQTASAPPTANTPPRLNASHALVYGTGVCVSSGGSSERRHKGHRNCPGSRWYRQGHRGIPSSVGACVDTVFPSDADDSEAKWLLCVSQRRPSCGNLHLHRHRDGQDRVGLDGHSGGRVDFHRTGLVLHQLGRLDVRSVARSVGLYVGRQRAPRTVDSGQVASRASTRRGRG